MQVVMEGGIADEDLARARLYGLLARLLYAAPNAPLLASIATAKEIVPIDPHAPLAAAWQKLQAASGTLQEGEAAEEYQRLFIGLEQGEVIPYMSWHLTGFLMEEPLVRLREDLARLGLARKQAVGEPEDHMAALCETMRLLIVDESNMLTQQHKFFQCYLQPWYANFARQLAVAPSANFYRAVAQLLKAFLDIEAQAFAMINLH